MGKSPQEMREQFSLRELAEYYVLIVGLDKFDSRSPLEKMFAAMAGVG